MSDNAYNSLFGNVKGSLSLVQNFYIEFFGTLIPGIVAVGCVFLLGLGFCYFVIPEVELIREIIRILFCTVGGMAFFLTISYVMGAIAYRRTPKQPDAISSYRQWYVTARGSSRDEVGRLSVSFSNPRVVPSGLFEWLCFWFDRYHWILRKAGSSIDYPYPLMRKYLCCRGLKHLADYVPWCSGSGGAAFKEEFAKGVCSKTYVNVIKQRLRGAGHANLVLDMVRNECHIRMLGSLWYVLTFVFRMLICSLAVAAVVTFVQCRGSACASTSGIEVLTDHKATNIVETLEKVTCRNVTIDEKNLTVSGITVNISHEGGMSRVAWFYGIVAVSLVIVFYCRHSIEFGFHYVRTREVAMLLESAWILDNVNYGDQIGIKVGTSTPLFGDIKKQAEQFRLRHCECDVCKYANECYGGQEHG